MINFYNTTFYDKESKQYSGRRYEGPAKSYVQYFFRKRLAVVANLIRRNLADKKDLVVIEDGCADGVVLRNLRRDFAEQFAEMVGTDISPGMIEAAKTNPENTGIVFYLKSSVPMELKADCLLAVGFVSPGIFADEFSFVKNHLKEGGVCIMSLVAHDSLYAKFKLKDVEIRKDYWNWSAYESELAKYFKIVDSKAYGLFVPKLWAIPVVGRLLQPILEAVFGFAPNLYHEKLYVLTNK